MKVIEAEIPDVKIIHTDWHEDSRGSFSEVYHRLKLADIGLSAQFVQDNQSVSLRPGTVRGLHFQTAPFAQDKLLRVVSGAILDVAVDLRKDAPTFGKHVCIRLSAENADQAFIPAGFAHGFCTLTGNTVVMYKTSHYYAPAHEGGIRWNDPDLQIAWPVGEEDALLSAKDQRLPRLRDIADSLAF